MMATASSLASASPIVENKASTTALAVALDTEARAATCVLSSDLFMRLTPEKFGWQATTTCRSISVTASRVSLTALMEPPMFGFMEPLTGADLGSRTG